MKRISYRIANFILIAALLLSGTVTAHAASTTEASERCSCAVIALWT